MSATGGIPMPLRSWNRRHLAVAGVVLLVAAAFLLGYLPRRFARSKLAASTAAQQGPPRVAVTKAVAVDAGRTLSLPADLVAFQQTFVNARASGYVRRWLVDIGDRVKNRQLLLELETPELDKQLASIIAIFSTIVVYSTIKGARFI